MFQARFEWNEKSSVVTFKPSSLLERGAVCQLTISGQAHSKGGAPLGSDFKKTYQTVHRFRSDTRHSEQRPCPRTSPSTSSVRGTGGYNRPRSLLLRRSPNTASTELAKLITFSPKSPESNFYVQGLDLTVNGFFTPGKTYTITFSANLKDNGDRRSARITFLASSSRMPHPSLSVGTLSAGVLHPPRGSRPQRAGRQPEFVERFTRKHVAG